MEHLKPQESIILIVLSATVDFPTCESIRMSRRVDKGRLLLLPNALMDFPTFESILDALNATLFDRGKWKRRVGLHTSILGVSLILLSYDLKFHM